MPSDPSGVQPKGTLTRHAADWFDDNLATGAAEYHVYGASPPYTYISFGLFNNANSGVVFKIYGLTSYNDSGEAMDGYFVNGTIGSLYGACTPIRPDYPAPYGQMYFDSETVAAFTDPPTNNWGALYQQFGTSGYDSMSYFSTFPIAIVPVGWSFVLRGGTIATDTGACFWYQVCNE